jgi:hypothetical protein
MTTAFRFPTLLLCATLLCSCGDNGPDQKLLAENQRITIENTQLRASVSETRKRNEELQTELANAKQRQGLLYVSNGMSLVACLALFCIGLATGMKIRRQYTTKSDVEDIEGKLGTTSS